MCSTQNLSVFDEAMNSNSPVSQTHTHTTERKNWNVCCYTHGCVTFRSPLKEIDRHWLRQIVVHYVRKINTKNKQTNNNNWWKWKTQHMWARESCARVYWGGRADGICHGSWSYNVNTATNTIIMNAALHEHWMSWILTMRSLSDSKRRRNQSTIDIRYLILPNGSIPCENDWFYSWHVGRKSCV